MNVKVAVLLAVYGSPLARPLQTTCHLSARRSLRISCVHTMAQLVVQEVVAATNRR